MANTSQEEMILRELKAAGTMGLHPTYFIRDLFVFQYNRAIHNIRKSLGCECKNGVHCMANEHIINRKLPDGTTKFFYEHTGPDWESMRKEMIHKREHPVINSQLSFL